MQFELDTINNDISYYLIKNTLDNADRNTLHSLYLRKEELEIILNKRYNDKAKGYCIRSRAKQIKEGKVGSRYFLGLEKQRQARYVIQEIKDGDNYVMEVVRYFQKLLIFTLSFIQGQKHSNRQNKDLLT